MPSVHSKYLRVFNAKQFKESVSEPQPSNVYMTIGRSVSWPDDNAPPQANTSVASYYDLWNNMIGGKKITGNDIRHVVPRFDWVSGTVYAQYDHLTDSLALKSDTNNFYVVTDEWNVYKCISNNYGAASTSKPTSISTTTDFQTADGYIWKYMYTISAEEQLRYVSADYIPVKTLTVNDGSLQWLVQNNAIQGGIHSIVLSNHGTGYTTNAISITITGDGQDAAAIAVRNNQTNSIDSIVVTDRGFDYTYATVSIASASGTGAVARAIISPPGGHGSDPLVELGGSNIMINKRLKSSEEGKLTTANDYRQIAIIEDPISYDGTYRVANTVVNQLTEITLNGTSAEYAEDETVYQGRSLDTSTFSGTVVEWDSANNRLKLTNTQGTPGSDLVKGVTSTAARFLSSVTNPNMQRYTGNLLYIDNVSPIQRSDDQVEDFQIVLKF